MVDTALTSAAARPPGNGPVRVGVVGCGNISDLYLANCREIFANLEVVAVSDLDDGRARAQAAKYGITKVLTPVEMNADPAVEVVLNLTPPAAHGDVVNAAIAAGKHVYTEKPLASMPDLGDALVKLARDQGVLLGGAPDTFLGAGLQTCRRLIDAGAIGEPVGAGAWFCSHGNEHWHPSPAFSYRPGGGPAHNLGPYYLTALVSLLGPVRRVTSATRISFPTRTVTSQPLAGQVIPVTTPTFIVAALDFAAGPVASFTATYDVWATRTPKIEIYGSEGTLSLPDPNTFGGPIRLFSQRHQGWTEVPLDPGFDENARGLGLSDMALALRRGDHDFRASASLANHVLEVMQACLDASEQGRHLLMQTTCDRPAPLDPATIPVRHGSSP